MLAFFAFIVAMFISMMLIPPLMKAAERYAFIDTPDERKQHTQPIPRIGGVAMVVATVAPILLWAEVNTQVLSLLYGIAVILVFGAWDDRVSLNYFVKFAGQLVAVVIVVFYGDVVIRFVPFHSYEPIPDYVAKPLTVFALLGITNAINLADGLDGLAGGITLLSVAVVSLLAFASNDFVTFIIAMSLMGSIIGFLRYNTHPAHIFMGDCGSQFLGFTGGVLVIMLVQRSGAILSPAMPLLLLGLPLIDTFLVMGQRLYERRSLFKPDRNHVHHKLIALGFDHYEAVVITYAVQAVFVTLAYLSRFNGDLVPFGLFALGFVAIGLSFHLARRFQWRIRHNEMPGTTPIAQLASGIRRSGILRGGPIWFCALTIPVYAVLIVLKTPVFPTDAAMTIYPLCAFAIIVLAIRRLHASYTLAERFLLYVTITAAIYYWSRDPHAAAATLEWERGYFVLLGLALIVSYRFAKSRSFGATPTDFLIVFIAMMIPTFAGALFPDNGMAEIAVKVLILFYSAELIVSQAGAWTWALRASVLALLVLLSMRVALLL